MRSTSVLALLALLGACGTTAHATDEADELLPGKLAIIRRFSLVKVIAQPGPGFHLPGLGNDPTVEGGTLHIFDTVAGAVPNDNTYALPPAGWRGLGLPPGSGGFKYNGAGSGSDPCRVVLLKPNLLKAICKGHGVTLNPPFMGDVGVILTAGVGSKRYCASFGGFPVQNDAGRLVRRSAAAPLACPAPPPPLPTTSSTSTTSSSSTSSSSVTTTSTTSTSSTTCCGSQRITLTSSVGTLAIDNLAPFPFPSGMTFVLDTGAVSAGFPQCRHDLVVPSGGFFVPNFEFPAFNDCAQISPSGCEGGTGDGAGVLWDGHGSPGLALTNVTTTADTADGVCDTTAIVVGTCAGGSKNGSPCASTFDCPGGSCVGASGCTTAPSGAGGNTVGNVDITRTASTSSGVRTLVEVPTHWLVWSDSVCSPIVNFGCCAGSNYNPADGDLIIYEWDTILRVTTDVATGHFADQNGNVCRRAGAGFANPTPDGPTSLTGTPPPGPCCVQGQPAMLTAVGTGFSGGAPLYDVGFKATMPMTVSSCGPGVGGGSCTVTTEACNQ